MDEIQKGVIQYLNEPKGYGFITIEGMSSNIFFHAKSVKHVLFEKLRKGDTVAVEGVEETEKGLSAYGVSLVS